MVVAMPIFAEEELHGRNPPHITRAIFARRYPWLRMANAVDEAGSMKHPYQPNRADPKEGRWAQQSPNEKGH